MRKLLHQRQNHGLTLIELLIALSITALILGQAVPSFNRIITNNLSIQRANWLIGAVNFSRHAAITTGSMVTLCAASGSHCGRDWNQGILVFTDMNADGHLNGEDRVVKKLIPPDDSGSVRWRSFRNRPYLQMTPMGFTNYQSGNFVYCPQNKDLRYARQIVINMQGRARLNHAINTDGERIDRYGRLLRC